MRILFILLMITITNLFGKNITISMYGNDNENIIFDIDLEIDKVGNLKPFQYFDIKDINNIKSLKILTGPGLQTTISNEKEIFIYYKDYTKKFNQKATYRMGVGRLYQNETEIKILMDSENWRWMKYDLEYHGIRDHRILNNIDNERASSRWKILRVE